MSDRTESVQDSEVALGDGPFPAALERFSWAAFLLPGLWALLNGLWRWFLIIFAVGAVTTFLSLMVNSGYVFGAASPPPAVAGASALLLSSISWLVSFAFARRALRDMWSAAAEKRTRTTPTAPAVSVSRFVSAQASWVRLGIGFLVLSLGQGFYRVLTGPSWVAWSFTADTAVTAGFLIIGFVVARRRGVAA